MVGVDICEQYISAAEKLKEAGHLSFKVSQEPDQDGAPPAKQAKMNGDDDSDVAKIPSDVDASRVTFKQVQ